MIVVVFWRTRVRFVVTDRRRSMPLLLSFVLIGFFIWIAENITTSLGAYQYPHQRTGWQAVSFGIYTSWALLVIVSFMIVAELKHRRAIGAGKLSVPPILANSARNAEPVVGAAV
jgi:uncharacterized membrane protein YoaT (DUF817 family)